MNKEKDGLFYVAVSIGLMFEIILVALVTYATSRLGASMVVSVIAGVVVAVLLTHWLGTLLKEKK